MKIRIIFLIVLLLPIFFRATPRYVKAGNPTPVPPYLTWTTASDSIQKCINISLPGDTIFVGAGTYKEEAHMTAGLALIGAGWDSTIIDTRELNPQNSLGAIRMADSSYLSGFRIIVSTTSVGTGVEIWGRSTYLRYCGAEYNMIENAGSGFYVDFNDSKIKSNIIKLSHKGFFVVSTNAEISNNIIVFPSYSGIRGNVNSRVIFRNNLIFVCITGNTTGVGSGFSDYNRYFNNTMILNNSNSTGITTWPGDTVRNNIIYGLCVSGIYTPLGVSISNNSITGALTGVTVEERQPIHYQYNNVWNCKRGYWNLNVDSTNISTNPMYVNPDSTDFHLQKYSPLIDRGDPSIIDPDGTRSDIGVFGGPFGTSYEYKDMPPATPVNIIAAVDSARIKLTWSKNTEADFSHYIIYRDTVSGFTPDSTRRIGTTVPPLFFDPLPANAKKLYYKIIAVDNQGLLSEPSGEIPVIINGTKDYSFPDNDTYKLYQNYPNPFNSSTTIRFRIQKPGQVALQLYTVSGELIQTLQNREYEPGYYEESLDLYSIRNQLASGFYLVSLTAYDTRATVAFRDMIKIIYLK